VVEVGAENGIYVYDNLIPINLPLLLLTTITLLSRLLLLHPPSLSPFEPIGCHYEVQYRVEQVVW